ncbi:MAG: H(+)-transporting ATPase [Pedosphaera sp.]|nr:H(+)-transporting ATPase [Pedosphaera sp.]
MRASKRITRESRLLFRQCRTASGELDEARLLQVVQTITRLKPRGRLALLRQLHRYTRLELASRTATVESALPLNEAQRSAYKAAIAARHGAGLIYRESVDPNVIGGLRLRVGHTVYDGTVLGRIEQLTESLR